MQGVRHAFRPALACRGQLWSLGRQQVGKVPARGCLRIQARAVHDEAPQDFDMLKMLDKIEKEGVQSEDEALERLKESTWEILPVS